MHARSVVSFAAAAFASVALTAACPPCDARSVTAVTISPAGDAVYGEIAGDRVRLLKACPREVFFGAAADDSRATAPRISPDGRWIVLERLWPYRRHGRVDESTVLLNVSDRRSYASSYYGRLFGAADPISTTWVAGKPATLELIDDRGVHRVALPGKLARGDGPGRCATL